MAVVNITLSWDSSNNARIINFLRTQYAWPKEPDGTDKVLTPAETLAWGKAAVRYWIINGDRKIRKHVAVNTSASAYSTNDENLIEA